MWAFCPFFQRAGDTIKQMTNKCIQRMTYKYLWLTLGLLSRITLCMTHSDPASTIFPNFLMLFLGSEKEESRSQDSPQNSHPTWLKSSMTDKRDIVSLAITRDTRIHSGHVWPLKHSWSDCELIKDVFGLLHATSTNSQLIVFLFIYQFIKNSYSTKMYIKPNRLPISPLQKGAASFSPPRTENLAAENKTDLLLSFLHPSCFKTHIKEFSIFNIIKIKLISKYASNSTSLDCILNIFLSKKEYMYIFILHKYAN